MARYEHERGEFTIPSTEWAGFKKQLREAVNRTSEKRFHLAIKVYTHLKSAKIKPSAAAEEARRFIEREDRGSFYTGSRFTDEDICEAIEAAVKTDWQTKRTKIRKPLKKDFPTAGNNVDHLEDGEASISFDNKTRRVVWNVPENNHACDTARESSLGKALFSALKSVKWTRTTGGSILGNDEYNRDADYEGGGGNYVKERFGCDAVSFSKQFKASFT